MALAQTHNSAFKRLLEAEPEDARRTALEFMAINAVLEKQIKQWQDRCTVLAHKVNEQEKTIAQLQPISLLD